MHFHVKTSQTGKTGFSEKWKLFKVFKKYGSLFRKLYSGNLGIFMKT